jgi:hypothetical protein
VQCLQCKRCCSALLTNYIFPFQALVEPLSCADLIASCPHVADGEKTHVLCSRIGLLEKGSDCVAHSDEWLVSDAKCNVEHECGFGWVVLSACKQIKQERHNLFCMIRVTTVVPLSIIAV